MSVKMLFGVFTGNAITIVAVLSQQEFLAWVASISAAVLALIPVYQKCMDAIQKSRTKDNEIRRKDCMEILKRQKAVHATSLERIKDLERQVSEWERLYQAGSRDYPKTE